MGGMELPVLSKGIDEAGKEFIVSFIPYLASRSYSVNISIGSLESNAVSLNVEPVASTGYAPRKVINNLKIGMIYFIDKFTEQIIPDAVASGAILPADQEIFNDTIDRAKILVVRALTNVSTLSDEEVLVIESALIQSGLFDLFMDMTTSFDSYRGAGAVISANLRIILDFTSACVSVVDDMWTVMDIMGLTGDSYGAGSMLWESKSWIICWLVLSPLTCMR